MEMEFIEKGSPTLLKRYVQGRALEINHNGVVLSVSLTTEGGARFGGIELQWSDMKHEMIAFIPKSFQCAELIAKQNMR